MRNLSSFINEKLTLNNQSKLKNGGDNTINVNSNTEILNTYLSNFNEFKNGNKYVIKFKHNGEYIEKGYDSCSTTSDIKRAKILSNTKKMQEVLYQFWIHLFNSRRLKNIQLGGTMFELEEI